VGFEPTITASEQAKTVHVLDRSATVIGRIKLQNKNKSNRRHQYLNSVIHLFVYILDVIVYLKKKIFLLQILYRG
jgi:hypothetical protein